MRGPIVLASVVGALGCGGVSGGHDGGGNIKLSGRLVVGEQTAYARALFPASPPAAGEPLVGYQLQCVTFATPPGAASGTADATGAVSLELAAGGVPFGCFVLDEQGAPVAVLVFREGEEMGQTVTLSRDADLGTVVVDLGNGVASSAVPLDGAVTGSGDVECPLGEWTATLPPKDGCPADLTSTFWVARTPAGEYVMSFRVGPMRIGGSATCADRVETDVAVSWTSGVLSFTLPADPSCPTKTIVATMTPNRNCTAMTAEMHYANCASCDQGCQCGGSLECPMPSTTVTRK